MRCKSTKHITKPANIKLIVAMSDRIESRPKPQTPWPLVQPDPIRVPIPTSRPASKSSGCDAEIVEVGSAANN